MVTERPPQSKKSKQSRFGKYFSTRGELNYTSLQLGLTVKSEDLPAKNKSFHTLLLLITHETKPVNEMFTIFTEGEITFVKTRWIDVGMNWGDRGGDKKSFYLDGMRETRALSFSLQNPPPPDMVFRSLAQNMGEILEGYATQGYIKLPEENELKPSETT